MNNEQSIANSLAQISLPPTPHLSLFFLRLFLYRAPDHRPLDHFGLLFHDELPGSPFTAPHTFNLREKDIEFRLHFDRVSLAQPYPLRFLLDAWCLDWDAPDCPKLHCFGGGFGLSPDDDAATLRAAFQALRTFPTDWVYTGGFLPK